MQLSVVPAFPHTYGRMPDRAFIRLPVGSAVAPWLFYAPVTGKYMVVSFRGIQESNQTAAIAQLRARCHDDPKVLGNQPRTPAAMCGFFSEL